MSAIPYRRSEARDGHPAAGFGHRTVTLADYLDTNDSIRLYRARRTLNEQARAVEEDLAEPKEIAGLAELLPPLAPAICSEGAYLVRTVERQFLQALADAPQETGELVSTVPAAFARVRRRVTVAPRLPLAPWIRGIAAILLAASITTATLRSLNTEPPAAKPAPLPSVQPERATPEVAVLPAAAPNPPKPAALYGHAAVIDSATLIVDGKQVHLSGIRGEAGSHAERLRTLIAAHGGVLACRAQSAGYLCLLPGKLDIASWAIRTGAAKPAPDGSAAPHRTSAGP